MLDLRRFFHSKAEAPIPYAVERITDRFVSGDEKRRAQVWRRNDGLFAYSEEEERYDEDVGLYWDCVRVSGLYVKHEDALRDAQAEVPWLRALP